jgi:DNA-binding response OmpR family regulator
METKILIVEDDLFIAGDIADIVEVNLGAMPVLASSCSEALSKIDSNTALGLLDIDVTDGPTYGVARRLRELGIPFMFISGNSPDKLPIDLQGQPYLSKPAHPAAIVNLAKTLSAELPG